jgi:hypothetical protein
MKLKREELIKQLDKYIKWKRTFNEASKTGFSCDMFAKKGRK